MDDIVHNVNYPLHMITSQKPVVSPSRITTKYVTKLSMFKETLITMYDSNLDQQCFHISIVMIKSTLFRHHVIFSHICEIQYTERKIMAHRL